MDAKFSLSTELKKQKEHLPVLSASDRDADLMRRSHTDGGAPTASQEAWRGGWVDEDLKFVRSTRASQDIPLCAALLSSSVSSEQDDLDWNSYLMLLQESVQIVFLLSNTLIDSFLALCLYSCHAELKAFVCISVFFSVSSCGLRAVSELYFCL